MASLRKRTISLPDDDADYVESLVSSGRYSSESEVVKAGLHALRDREAGLDAFGDDEIERWLREDVAPVYDAMRADPSRGLSPDEVLATLRAHHEKWVKERAG